MSKYDNFSKDELIELCNKKNEQLIFLWSLLDDISTAGDIFKPETNGYFNIVNKSSEKRSEVADSDGYSILIKE